MLTGIVDALETLSYDDQVKEKMFGDSEGSLRELLANVDEHEALVEIMQAVEDLLITDELMQVILGDYDPFSTEDFDDIDSSLNCSISEITVPEKFARTQGRVIDLKNIIETELMDRGFDVAVRQISRPNATTIRINFEGEDNRAEAVDSEIEKILQTVIDYGFGPYGNRPGDDYVPTRFQSKNSSLDSDMNSDEAQYQVYYTDENGNEIEEPAIITVDPGLTGMELYEEIQDEFNEQYPGCSWDTICDMNDEVKVDSSKKSYLNSSVHDNPALKTLVERVRNVAQQVSAVPYVADGNNGYKIIVRGMDSADFEGIADSLGIELDSIKPLDDGFAVVVQEEKLNGSCVNCDEDTELQDGSMHYRQYFITGSDGTGYVAISPYGKYSPKVYRTIDEAKADIDKDIKLRFPERN